MSYSFYFEDGLGNVVDENEVDPMVITEDEDPFKLEELASYSKWVALRNKLNKSDISQGHHTASKERIEKIVPDSDANSRAKGKRVSNDIKAHAVHLADIHPKNSTRAVAFGLKLDPRTMQKWYKSWKADPDSLFPTIGCPKIIEPDGELAEATKSVVTDLFSSSLLLW